MPEILNDRQLKQVIGDIIIDGDEDCVRVNSYFLRVGNKGEFINSGNEFQLGDEKDEKKGIRLRPGHSVALTAFETLDFRKETVEALFPGHALHAILSPSTDLSREGIVAPTTQVDAGYHGTLNWTLNNTSSEPRKFRYKENIYRLLILKLSGEEVPDRLYAGRYQGRLGHVPSERKGPPVGMKRRDWVDSLLKEGDDVALKNLEISGYPYNLIGKQFRNVRGDIESVSDDYARIDDKMKTLGDDVQDIKTSMGTTFKQELRDALRNEWLIISGGMALTLAGLLAGFIGSERACNFFTQYIHFISMFMILAGLGVLVYNSIKK